MTIRTRLLTALIYPLGDIVAQVILQEFHLYRVISLTFLAFAFYQWEIPRWFKFLDNITASKPISILSLSLTNNNKLNWLGKTLGAMSYFNPLWIARHMFFISLSTINWLGVIDFKGLILSSLILGTKSFLVNLPISILGNYIVQARLKLEYRFLGSVILTSLMTICYALAHRFL